MARVANETGPPITIKPRQAGSLSMRRVPASRRGTVQEEADGFSNQTLDVAISRGATQRLRAISRRPPRKSRKPRPLDAYPTAPVARRRAARLEVPRSPQERISLRIPKRRRSGARQQEPPHPDPQQSTRWTHRLDSWYRLLAAIVPAPRIERLCVAAPIGWPWPPRLGRIDSRRSRLHGRGELSAAQAPGSMVAFERAG